MQSINWWLLFVSENVNLSPVFFLYLDLNLLKTCHLSKHCCKRTGSKAWRLSLNAFKGNIVYTNIYIKNLFLIFASISWPDKNMSLPLPGSSLIFWKWNKVKWTAKISRGENTNFTLKWNSDNCVNIVPASWFLPCRFCLNFISANHSQRNQYMIDSLQNIWNMVFVLAVSSWCNPSSPITM